MSEDLSKLIREKLPHRPSPFHPQLRGSPRVKGGLSLDGGPKLELGDAQPKTNERDKPPAAEDNQPSTPPEPRASSDAAAQRTTHRPPRQGTGPGATGGPHLSIPLATPRDEAPAAEESTAKANARATKPADPEPVEQVASAVPDVARQFQLAAVGLEKSFRKSAVEVPVLRGVDLNVQQGEMLCVVGQSGSGKTTLLHLLATLDAPDAGEIYFDARRIDRLPTTARDRLRNRRFGMIFQFYHLLPELTTLENILAPLMITHGVWSYWRQRRELRDRAEELLDMVGLTHRRRHKPRELSGGEMQRTAIARALVAQPELLLADEPTGNLDHATGQEILHLLRGLNDRRGLTIVMVTHDPQIADQADRTVRLVDGRVAG